jgi:hypothetical protein
MQLCIRLETALKNEIALQAALIEPVYSVPPGNLLRIDIGMLPAGP